MGGTLDVFINDVGLVSIAIPIAHRHPVTLGIEELLLSKRQVINPATADLVNSAAILLSHPVWTGGGANAGIDPVAAAMTPSPAAAPSPAENIASLAATTPSPAAMTPSPAAVVPDGPPLGPHRSSTLRHG